MSESTVNTMMAPSRRMRMGPFRDWRTEPLPEPTPHEGQRCKTCGCFLREGNDTGRCSPCRGVVLPELSPFINGLLDTGDNGIRAAAYLLRPRPTAAERALRDEDILTARESGLTFYALAKRFNLSVTAIKDAMARANRRREEVGG
jgi:hypothetical protein